MVFRWVLIRYQIKISPIQLFLWIRPVIHGTLLKTTILCRNDFTTFYPQEFRLLKKKNIFFLKINTLIIQPHCLSASQICGVAFCRQVHLASFLWQPLHFCSFANQIQTSPSKSSPLQVVFALILKNKKVKKNNIEKVQSIISDKCLRPYYQFYSLSKLKKT